MITESVDYMSIIEYLTEHLNLFENSSASTPTDTTVIAEIEAELCNQIINVCNQNKSLTFHQRNAIIQEVDAIIYDLEEILSGVINNPVNSEQKEFIREFTGLIKNIFDTAIHQN